MLPNYDPTTDELYWDINTNVTLVMYWNQEGNRDQRSLMITDTDEILYNSIRYNEKSKVLILYNRNVVVGVFQDVDKEEYRWYCRYSARFFM